MAVTPSSSAAPEERLHEILAEYLQAVDAGQQPIRDEFVNRHPELADELRDFFANQDRLAEAFPEEQQASVDMLIDQLAATLAALPGSARSAKSRQTESRRDAEAIYHMVFGTLHKHLVRGTQATGADIDHLVRLTLRAAGAGGAGGSRR